jgi:hypothetical protein
MEVVLKALEDRTPHVATGYRLMFNDEANDYRVEEAPS